MFIFANGKRIMERNLLIELLEDGDKVSLYLRMKTNKIMDEIRSTISPEMRMQMEMSVAIANRIYEILEAKGMTQKELAKRLGKTETEVSRWLSGTHNLTLSTVCKISSALGEEIVTVPKKEMEPELV